MLRVFVASPKASCGNSLPSNDLVEENDCLSQQLKQVSQTKPKVWRPYSKENDGAKDNKAKDQTSFHQQQERTEKS